MTRIVVFLQHRELIKINAGCLLLLTVAAAAIIAVIAVTLILT